MAARHDPWAPTEPMRWPPITERLAADGKGVEPIPLHEQRFPAPVIPIRPGVTAPSGLPGRGFVPRLAMLTPAECAATSPRGYILKRLIAPGDVVILFGAPGSGKSVLAPHIGYAIAQGREVFGRRVRQGRVLYIAAEDETGMRQRITALMRKHGDADNFRLVSNAPSLATKEGQDQLLAAVDDFRPALVIVDTVAAAFRGLELNKDTSVPAAVARRITGTGAAVALVHHVSKADDTAPKGGGDMHADADVGMRLVKVGGEVQLTFSKNRNGPSDLSLAFAISGETLGEDDDGDAITAPMLTEVVATAGQQGTGPRLSPTERTAIGFLTTLLAKEGAPPPQGDGFPAGNLITCVPEERWRQECDEGRLSTGADAKNRAKTFGRVYQSLIIKRFVATRGGVVWLAPARSDNGAT